MLALSCNTAGLTYPPDAEGDDAGDDAGALPFPVTSQAHVIVEPSDNGGALLAAINGAKTSIHMTMYLLSNNAVTSALIARKKAGVDVKVILNKTFPDPGFDNTPTFDQLSQNGVPVTWAPAAFTYTHSKCVLIDASQAWIMTMNLTFSSASTNREYLVIDDEPADVSEAESVFAADFSGTPATTISRLVVSPINARARLVALIAFATQTLDVEAESLSDAGIVAALRAAKQAGIAVRVVVSDQMYSAAMLQAIAALKGAGIPIVKLANPYQHAKAIVADAAIPERAVAFVGSENFTQNSIDSNREIGLFLATDLATLAATINADFNAGTPL